MATLQSPLSSTEIMDSSDQVGFWLQVGFVEGVLEEDRKFDSLEAALRHILQHNLESAVLLWNAIPVSLDYTDDIPAIMGPLLDLLNTLQNQQRVYGYEFKIFSKNLSANWYIDAGDEYVAICAEWYRIPGDYEEALNSFSTTTFDRTQFLCEWKLLLQQCIQAIRDAGAEFSNLEASEKFRLLCEIEAAIPNRGRFYQSED